MSLDFPSNPVDGQTHVQNGQVWTWRAPPGVWSVGDSTGQITEIVEDDSGVSYFVIGDTLIQMGTGGGNASGSAVVFPVAYPVGEVPIVNAGTGRSDGMAAAYSVTNTGFTGLVTRHDGVATSSDYVYISVGEAPDDLKKPKSVLGGGAGGDVPIVDEGDGYQIVGNKMIAWGLVQTTASGTTVNFPKEFGATPSVTLQANTTTTVFGTVQSVGTTSFFAQGRNLSGTQVDIACWWIAQGDCLPEDAMPTTVIGNGVTEHHDPTGVGSWRVIGRTLECWGTTPGGTGDDVVTFPKAFAANPVMSGMINNTAGDVARVVEYRALGTTSVNILVKRADNSSLSTKAVTWHAIGEVAP